jgi:hypothetical protein
MRPMSLGEILDRTFQIYRSRFLAFAAIAAVPALGTMAVEAAAYILWGTPKDGLHIFVVTNTLELGCMLGFYHFALFLQFLVWPGFIDSVSRYCWSNQPAPSKRSALRLGKTDWRGSLALSAILLAAVLVLPELVFAGLFIGIAYVSSEILKFSSDAMDLILTPVLSLLCFSGWAAIGWMNAELSIAVPIRAVEKTTVRVALRQAWKRARGLRFNIFVAWLMPAILGWILTLTVSEVLHLLRGSCDIGFVLPVQIRALNAIYPPQGWCVPSPVVSSLHIASNAVILALLGPIFPIALTLFYYDQRIRHEGYDIEQMMDAAGLNTIDSPAPAEDSVAQPAAQENRP